MRIVTAMLSLLILSQYSAKNRATSTKMLAAPTRGSIAFDAKMSRSFTRA
jgi:hypothetical protein